MGRLVLVGGGVRSGKSAFALARAAVAGPRCVLLATAEPRDAGMQARIARHRTDRGDGFRTVEEPRDVPGAFRRIQDADAVVLDCLTLWLSNLLCDGLPEDAILVRVDALLAAAADAPFLTIVVTNEVGMSVHPETDLGRTFQDVAGRAHQRLARAASEIHVAILGVVLRLRPGPLELAEPPAPPPASVEGALPPAEPHIRAGACLSPRGGPPPTTS